MVDITTRAAKGAPLTNAEMDANLNALNAGVEAKAPVSHAHSWAQLTDVPVQATRWPTLAEVGAAPAAHGHAWAQITGIPVQATRWPSFAEVTSPPATATRWPTFAEVTGKPATFAPTAHTHPVAQVTGLGSAATRNVGAAAGNLMEVGTFGIGADSQEAFWTDAASGINTGISTGLSANSGVTGLPSGFTQGRTAKFTFGHSSYPSVLLAQPGNKLAFFSGSVGEPVNYVDIYHTGNQLNIGTTAATARAALGLGTAATKNVGTAAGDAMAVGTGGLGVAGPLTNNFKSMGNVNQFFCGYQDPEITSISAGITLAYSGDWWSQLIIQPSAVPRVTVRSWYNGNAYSPVFTLYHSGNLLNIGTTAATARSALQLTGEWVDLRPYLKPGFYWDTTREGKNPHPQIRKLSCGRVELNGIVSFNATSGPRPVGVFINIPAPFRPSLTSGGLTFADSSSPLSFGHCNWIAVGEVSYAPPAVPGDISMIPVGLPATLQGGAIALTGIYWFT